MALIPEWHTFMMQGSPTLKLLEVYMKQGQAFYFLISFTRIFNSFNCSCEFVSGKHPAIILSSRDILLLCRTFFFEP